MTSGDLGTALVNTSPPFLHGVAGTSSVVHALRLHVPNGYRLITVEGKHARHEEALYDEFARKFNFPGYFGRNWDALDECLADLAWLPADGYVVIVLQAEELLADDQARLPTLMSLLHRVAEEWATPIAIGEWWDREGRAFHVVLQILPAAYPATIRRFTSFGLPLQQVGP